MIQGLYQDPSFVEAISYPHTHFKHIYEKGWCKDLYDAEAFQQFIRHYEMLLADGRPNLTLDCWRNHLALSVSHDGVNPFKSSAHSFWPIFVKILNLPPHLRIKYKYMLMVGLVPGLSEPPCPHNNTLIKI